MRSHQHHEVARSHCSRGYVLACVVFRREVEATDKALSDKNPLSQYGEQRLKSFKDELEDLQIELNFGGSDYRKALAELDVWERRELEDKNYVSDAEREAVQELKKAKKALIDRDYADEIQQYWERAADIEYSLMHTAFEKQMRDIELWKEAQLKKAEVGEETAAIIAGSAAKEAEAFEREADRIKDLTQSLDDKIFAQEHSQYEQDLRRIQQERIRYYEDFQKEGFLNAETQAKIEHWYNNAVNDLNKKLTESRKSGGDYAKAPDSGMQRGNNGIMVIGGDQIFDDGLIESRQQEIGLITDENQLRAQLSQNLTPQAKALLEQIQATKNLTEAQKQLLETTRQTVSGFQVIEGDRVVDMPQVQILTQELQQFSENLQESTALMEQSDPAEAFREATGKLIQSAQDFPPEYFRQLADGTKAVSEMQMSLTESTQRLIEAQGNLRDALTNLPKVDSNERQMPTEGFQRLTATTQDVVRGQDLLARTTRQTSDRLAEISDIPRGRELVQKGNGLKLGFDYDTFKDVMLTGAGIWAGAAATGVGVVSVPALIAGTIGTAGLAALAKGSYDETTSANNQPYNDDRLRAITANDVDLTEVETALASMESSLQGLSNFDVPLSNILQEIQNFKSTEPLDAGTEMTEVETDYLTPLTNIDTGIQSVLQELQARQTQETTLSFETIITPLNNIAGLVQNIFSALENRQPAQITVAPNNNINLGGAYVFDNAMKASLVEDITSKIVTAITTAVTQATNKSSYGFAG